MLNLRDELQAYIDDGSINWNKLSGKLKAIYSDEVKKIQDGGVKVDSNFIVRVQQLASITFKFVDKNKNIMQNLSLIGVAVDKNGILCRKLRIHPVINTVETDDKDGTPMWIENEWYQDNEGDIYKWMGTVSVNPDNPNYLNNNLVNVKTRQLKIVSKAELASMQRVEPTKDGDEIKYIPYKGDI